MTKALLLGTASARTPSVRGVRRAARERRREGGLRAAGHAGADTLELHERGWAFIGEGASAESARRRVVTPPTGAPPEQ